ncbi:BTAD domain-containing putative transcriptional regulator [Dactylosporangium sp. NPDC005555]|uniref:AfsR/SARP family transcriptional regulator n=1 Tax=Dactylosporangium sp. NPDC005555 TaxID=3154889 RepID=UPI0033B114D2
MKFRLLGGVEAIDGVAPLDVGPARQRGVLAALMVDAGRVVPTEDLVERVWGAARPRRARPTLYSYLSRLRGVLGAGAALRRRAGGYLLAAEPEAVDLHRFRLLCARARTAPGDEAAAGLFGEALELWRGTAFGDLDTPYFNLQREAADRDRHAAALDHGDVLLRLGRHGALLGELFARAEAHPLDERVTGQLMLALYRGGRSADALARYRLTWERLREDVGGEPGAPLRRLHRRILAGDPTLADIGTGDPTLAGAGTGGLTPADIGTGDPTLAGAGTGDPALAGPGHPDPVAAGGPGPAAGGGPWQVPRQLPAPPAVFVGRQRELAEVDRVAAAGAAMAVVTIGGTGGIGKTTLALHWAHRDIARFPDGQLYVDLRGFDPADDPVPASVALRGFLEALGVAPSEIPADLAGRSALYRSVVAGRRMLVLLDNARTSAQVEPLLPGSPACTVLVTGRRQLAGLVTSAGARPLTLEALPSAEGRELLVHHLGTSRAAQEPEAAAALVAHCAGLPLATSIIAARARIQSGLTLAALAEELDDRSARLDALDAGDLNADLRAVFAASYRALEPPLAAAFGLLGAAPGPDIGLGAAAELIGQPAGRTRAALRRLTAAYLLQEHTPGRFHMHDLVHLYAAECCAADQPDGTARLARARLATHYTDDAIAADRVLAPQRTPIVASPGAPVKDAMAWFAAEHDCLLAIQRAAAEDGLHAEVWRLAWALDTYQWRRALLAERVAMLETALPATGAHPGAAALNHRLLGRAYVPLGRHDRALHHLHLAVAGYETAADPDGQAQTQLNLALAWEHAGDDRQALTHAEANLRIRATLAGPAREAEALNAVGWYHARVGQHEDADGYCRRALAICRAHGFLETEAYTRDSLGYIARHRGRPAEALRHYGGALELRRMLGDTYEEGDTLTHLGEVYVALGRPKDAATAWLAALALFESQGRTREAAAVRRRQAEGGTPR